MENIWKDESDTGTNRSLKDRIDLLEKRASIGKMQDNTAINKSIWKYPSKWQRNFNKSNKKIAEDKVLVLYLNIKGEIETPLLMPLYSGNIIIYKNKAHEFDPRAMWIIKAKGKIVKVLLIREIDRRPVSNLDWDEIKTRGDATDSDEILVKMVTKAMIEKQKKAMNKGVLIFVVIAIIAAIVFFLFMK